MNMGHGHSHGKEEHVPGKAVHVLLSLAGIGIFGLGVYLADAAGGNPDIFVFFGFFGIILLALNFAKGCEYIFSSPKKIARRIRSFFR